MNSSSLRATKSMKQINCGCGKLPQPLLNKSGKRGTSQIIGN